MKHFIALIIVFPIVNFSCAERDNFKGWNYHDNRKTEDRRDTSANYLALGDSYTIGEGVEEKERFPVQLAAKLNNAGVDVARPKIIAQTGWTTDELETGIQNAELENTYDLVTLLIGVNNQYRGRSAEEYRDEFADLLQKSIDLAGADPQNVIVISIPDYGVTPFAAGGNPEKISAEIDKFNLINREVTQNRGANYVYITGISKLAKNNPDLLADDNLHPSSEMYRLWVKEIFPVAKQILEEN